MTGHPAKRNRSRGFHKALVWTWILVLSACASGHHRPFEDTIPLVRDLAGLEERVQTAVGSSPYLALEEIGRVAYAGFEAPVWLVSFRPAQTVSHRIWINAGIHGNEPAGVECAVQMVERLAKDPDAFPETTFDIIPLINVWGWAHDIRFNRAGTDINRDFASFNSQEATAIRKFVNGKTYDLMLDLHEDPSATGFYVYQYAQKEKSLPEKVIETIQSMGYPIEQNVSMVILKTENGIIDAPMWGLHYMRLTGQLSAANYYRLHHSERVYTVETPTERPFSDRLEMQRTALTVFIAEVMQRPLREE